MRNLDINEVNDVAGAVDQASAIGWNLAIAGIGTGFASAAATTGMVLTASGVGIVAGLILVGMLIRKLG